ncbi:sugar ABC transporter ATP-binding protein [Clostridia bacterium]|nr:sugar ABC transporter ATP-binding protein [Clostridia bacterium]
MSFQLLKRILSYTKPYRIYMAGAFVCAALSVGLTLLAPVLVGRAIDNIIGKGNVNFAAIAHICAIIAIAVAGAAAFQWLMGLCTSVLSYRTIFDLRKHLFAKLHSVPLSFIDSTPHGDIISRIVNDTDAVGDGLLQGFTQLFSGILTIVATLAFMLVINYKIALIIFVITPLSLFVSAFIAKLSAKRYMEQAETQGELSSYVEEITGNQRLVIAFNEQAEVQEKFEEINNRLYTCGQKAQFASSLSNPSTRFVNAIIYTAACIAGALAAISGGMTIGTVSCFLTYATQYTRPFNEITSVIGQIQSSFAGAKRIFAVLDEENQPPDEPNAAALTTCNGNVTVRDVSFSYTPQQNLIKNFNLVVKSGQKIAIVGPTGCGKTTLINLLMRFYDTNSGTISIDGIPSTSITRSSLRQLYGMVLQDSWLFGGTVRENLCYGNPNATDKEIISAAKAAYAHEFIMHTENGYNTIITEDGGNLSGGQKQLLCIARVLLCNACMLILDEATSNIDTLTEVRVQKAFAKMMQGKTSFVVAHRLSTIQTADVILVMNNGNIIEQGSHEELIAKQGFYYELFNAK